MKNLLIVTLIMVSVNIGFAQETMTRKEKKAAKEADQIEKVKTLINANTWQFDASQMLPSSGKSKVLTTPYNIVVNDNQLDCYLPYFGVAYRAEYASSESPMSFKSEIDDYAVDNWKKRGWIITFKASNKQDRLNFILHVSETGSATLSVNSTDRQPVSYYGNIAEIENKK